MRYMMLIYMDEQALDQDSRQACYQESAEVARRFDSEGHYLAASPLQPTSAARILRVREGRAVTTDGPFAETREQLAGYYLVQAADLDEAIALAARIPGARWGTVEIRPVLEVEGLPELSR